MNNLQSLIKEITTLTKTIESDYPERYQFLDEIPATIPSEKKPEVNNRLLNDYLDNLKQMLKHHIETRKNINKQH